MGTGKSEYVMCRNLDCGAYEIGNVRIDYSSSNLHEKKVANKARKGYSTKKYNPKRCIAIQSRQW